MAQWCNPLTLKPEQSGGVGSTPSRTPPPLERHDKVSGRVAESRDEWPSGLYSLRQVTKVMLDRVRSDSGCVTLETQPHNSPRRPSEGTLN